MPVDYASVPPQSRKEFEAAFLKLTKLQSMSVCSSWTYTYFLLSYLSGKNIHSAQLEEGGLYPLQVLVQPVSLRFKYHFQGTRQTNRLEKVCEITIIFHCFIFMGSFPQPEWYFTHILNVIHEQRQFLESTIQSLLAATEYKEITAWVKI